jgi:hypothetical protein
MFLEKANIFRGCTFVLGADTMVRMLNPKYYADAKELTASGLSPEQVAVAQSMALVAALATIAERGIRFVVGGRHCAGMRAGTGTEDVDGFLTCSQILVSPAACVLPLALRHMFAEVEESAFRVDLSSSQIRKEKQKAQEQDQEQMNIGKKD